MTWLAEPDEFTFTLKLRDGVFQLLAGEFIPTKRQVIRVVMSVFDPLGLVAAFVVHGKCLIQDIWRAKVNWDEQIPEELVSKWRRWVDVLQNLIKVKIPRCYFPGYDPRRLECLELHVFVDASEEAYACTAYFRIVDRGLIRCALVSAKTKVAPLNPMSVPRLELQAAVIGARLMKAVQENHSLPISRRVIWGDSKTVQSWLRSDQRKYRQFVAFRVSEILSETSLEEWRWVPTRSNVADEATKWSKGPSFQSDSRWFTGPEFLYEDESGWPEQKYSPTNTQEEIRPIHAHHLAYLEPVFDYHRFSRYQRLLRTVGYALRFIDHCRRKPVTESSDTGLLSRNELLKAAVAAGAKRRIFRRSVDDTQKQGTTARRNQKVDEK
ncbi:uncharacterized protein LOC134286994 [Aedes albopictus]|uniref:RNase H type-1 domain-containing protein n=1 Tax=Aedes albopictus TaxID=7160 RepID=A0ABM1XVS5_AEDAL